MKKLIATICVVLVAIFVPSLTLNAKAATKSYNSYINARTLQSNLNLQPTYIYEPESLDDIPTFNTVSTYGITSLLLTPDKNMNITLGGITTSFTDLFTETIKGTYIPVLRLTEETVDGFISYMNNIYYIKDMMVVSDSIEVLKKIHDDPVATITNTVYDLTKVQIPSQRFDLWEYIAEANVQYCNILMFNGSDNNIAVACEYVSAMSKVCWTYTQSDIEAINAISVGTQGLVNRSKTCFKTAMSYFSKSGFTRAQHIAAHRGITSYANENSLTSVSASVSEGATHIEIDVQVCYDGEIVLCHDGDAKYASGSTLSFAGTRYSAVRALTLNEYSDKYGETFANMQEVIEAVKDTDVILIIELKMGGALSGTITNIKPIEKFMNVMRQYPEMDGHWFTITFYSPLAQGMRECAPEIPVGFLGAGLSGYESSLGLSAWGGEWKDMTQVPDKIAFMHKNHTILDECYASSTDTTAQTYLARGYVQNGWTYNNLNHFKQKVNIATSNVAEKCAMAIKEIAPTTLNITKQQLANKTISVNTINYCGWQEDRVCEIIVVEQDDTTAKVLLYYMENVEGQSYGLYSQLLTYNIV